MTKTKTKPTKKPRPNKTPPRIPLKEFIPNYRDFQKEVARLEEMLGPTGGIDVASDLPAGMTREWAVDAWKVVKANAEMQFRPSKPGTEFPSGIYADRAWLATLRIMNSPFNPQLKSLAISQTLDASLMKEKATKRRARATRKAEASQS